MSEERAPESGDEIMSEELTDLAFGMFTIFMEQQLEKDLEQLQILPGYMQQARELFQRKLPSPTGFSRTALMRIPVQPVPRMRESG